MNEGVTKSEAQRERKREYEREYYKTHKEARKEYQKEYRKTHKEQAKEHHIKYRKTEAGRSSGAKTKAKNRLKTGRYKQIWIDGRLVPKHRLVMEAHIGRKLTSKEVVHHIDGNKRNNDKSNLMLFKNNSEHLEHHRMAKDLK